MHTGQPGPALPGAEEPSKKCQHVVCPLPPSMKMDLGREVCTIRNVRDGNYFSALTS